MQRVIVVKKSNNRLVSFGAEDTSRFSFQHFDIIAVTFITLPDELRFCKYENGSVVVDETYKQQVLQEEASKKQKSVDARQYIKTNNPADVNSVPALRDRVKRLEVLLGIYEWM